MSNVTPEELRQVAKEMAAGDVKGWPNTLVDAADAWEADLWMRDHYKAESDAFAALNDSLRKRLEAAEKAMLFALGCTSLDENVRAIQKSIRGYFADASDTKSSDEKDTQSTAHAPWCAAKFGEGDECVCDASTAHG